MKLHTSQALSPRFLNTKLNQVKKTLHRQLTAQFSPTLSPALVRRALEEAEQTATVAGFPHLLFPLLAEENVRRVVACLTTEDSIVPGTFEPVAA